MDSFICPLCGYRYNPAEHVVCASCPLQKGCEMVCCPSCGYQTVDLHKSRLARLAQVFLNPGRINRAFGRKRVELTLADILPGQRAKVIGFLDGLPPERRAHLQAYGLSPNDWVRVVQHSPVTVIQFDHTELALEMELASEIQVEKLRQGPTDEYRE